MSIPSNKPWLRKPVDKNDARHHVVQRMSQGGGLGLYEAFCKIGNDEDYLVSATGTHGGDIRLWSVKGRRVIARAEPRAGGSALFLEPPKFFRNRGHRSCTARSISEIYEFIGPVVTAEKSGRA